MSDQIRKPTVLVRIEGIITGFQLGNALAIIG